MAAYVPGALNCMIPRIGAGPALWTYESADAHGDVDAVGYFSDGADKGMVLNDLMCVVDTATATITWHRVLDGGLTIGASAS
jgi:hypothetical protein